MHSKRQYNFLFKNKFIIKNLRCLLNNQNYPWGGGVRFDRAQITNKILNSKVYIEVMQIRSLLVTTMIIHLEFDKRKICFKKCNRILKNQMIYLSKL